MTRNRTRLKRIEEEVGRLPLSPEQRADLEERLACRYTVLLDIHRRVAHRMLEFSGPSPGPPLIGQPRKALRSTARAPDPTTLTGLGHVDAARPQDGGQFSPVG